MPSETEVPRLSSKLKQDKQCSKSPENKKNIWTEKQNPFGSYVAAVPGIHVRVENDGA